MGHILNFSPTQHYFGNLYSGNQLSIMTVQRFPEAGASSNDGFSTPAPSSFTSLPATTLSRQPASSSKENSKPQGQNHQQCTPQKSVRPQPTLNSFDRYSEWTGCLNLRMVPDPGMPDYGKAPWAAWFNVHCQDVPRLMRDGFFWSVDNVLPEEGNMPSAWTAWEAKGFRHTRRWILSDKPNNHGGTPRWVGRLYVISPSMELLARFRVQNLSPNQICSANAWDSDSDLVYNYNCRVSGQNFNCIYDDEPLEGWWPWPKKGGAGGGVFRPSAPGVNWEDELFPNLPLAPQRRQPAAAPAINAYSAPYVYSYPPNTAPSGSGCIIL
jgi:hypothetical protein